jgi:uncharacterized protein (TIGR00255 family)
MSLASMTGFARTDGTSGRWNFVWELRSVNGKGLDVRMRLPSGMDGIDKIVRARLQKTFGRGNVTANLQLDQNGGSEGYQINEKWLAELKAAAAAEGPVGPEIVAGLLTVRGVVEQAQGKAEEAEIETRDEAILESLDRAIAALLTARQDEGARLSGVLTGVVDEIEALLTLARNADASRPEKRRERLQSMLSDLLAEDPPLPEERLAQELALQMTRSDIVEEIDRLTAHIGQARELLSSGEPVGRRLDFLAQEFNREANTLCSKSSDVELTRAGMDMKVAIDRMREQVQNIE